MDGLSTESADVAAIWAATQLTVEWLKVKGPGPITAEAIAEAYREILEAVYDEEEPDDGG